MNDGVISKTRKRPANALALDTEIAIVRLLKKRKRVSDISAEIGVSPASVQRIRAAHKIPVLVPHQQRGNQYTQYDGPDYRSKPRPRTEAEIRMRNAMQGLSHWPAMARRAY